MRLGNTCRKVHANFFIYPQSQNPIMARLTLGKFARYFFRRNCYIGARYIRYLRFLPLSDRVARGGLPVAFMVAPLDRNHAAYFLDM